MSAHLGAPSNPRPLRRMRIGWETTKLNFEFEAWPWI
jgi:hypothetical protein